MYFTLKTLRLLLVFQLIIHCANVSAQKEVDSLKKLLVVEKDDEKRFVLMSEMVRYSLWNQPDSALLYSQTFLAEAELKNNKSETARGHNFLGLCQQVRGNVEKAIGHYLEALPVYEELRDTFMIAMMYNNIGASYQYREKYDETIEYYQKALKLFQAIPDHEWEASVRQNICVQFHDMGRYEEALQMSLESVEIFTQLGNQLYKGYSELSIGTNLQHLGRYEEAIAYYKKAEIDINPNEDKLVFSSIYSNLCGCFVETGRIDSAAIYCEKGLLIAQDQGAIKELRDCHRTYTDFYKKTGNFQKALEHVEKEQLYSDSLFNSKKDTQVTEMLTKYESEKKEQELEISNLRLEEQINSKRLLVAGIGLIGLLLIGMIYIVYNRNKTNRKLEEKNQIIEKALGEKEILLKEIHHRVKNNLQVVSSLLSIQSRGISDEKAQEAITESRNRVRSMALIHQNLYSETNLTGINVADYIKKLGESLFSTYKIDNDLVEVKYEVDPMILDVDTTIPLGLILNELITNALKYAFQGRGEGKILIQLKEQNNRLELIVADDGVGIDEGVKRDDSFGMKMIQSFAQKLEAEWKIGKATLEDYPGTSVSLIIGKYKKSMI